MSLLINIDPVFEKTAAKTPLGDNDATWGSEILAALYKQHPFMGKFDIHLQMHGQDLNLGYMYGTFIVRNSSMETPVMNRSYPGKVDKVQSADSAGPMARIPVIVEDKKLFSFDIFIDKEGRFLPLSEDSLETNLFSVSNYVGATKPRPLTPSDQGMNPDVPLSGYGTDMSSKSSGYAKMGSATLAALAKESQALRDSFVEEAQKDPWITQQLEKNAELRNALYQIKTLTPFDAVASVDHDSVLVEKVAGGFKITRALSEKYLPEYTSLTNAQAKHLPTGVKEAAIRDNFVLMTKDGINLHEAESALSKIVDVDDTGIYSLMERSGEATQGVVIAGMKKLSGDSLSLKLAVTPSGASVQEKIAGVRTGDFDFSKISGSAPSGEGVFLLDDETITEPVTILNSASWNDGIEYVYSDSFGTKGVLKEASVKQPVAFGKSDYLFPETARFIPIKPSSGVMGDAISMDKIASDVGLTSTVTIIADGNLYSFRGGCGINELPYKETNYIKIGQALLLLGALGDSNESAHDKVKKASKGEEVNFVGIRSIKLPAKTKEAYPLSFEEREIINSLRVNLVKEAAVVPSTGDTVNSVLSLSFLTPENVESYMEAVPEYEASVSKLCELLIAVRLGLPDVPESAVLSSIKGITAALAGFKMLAERRRHFDVN